jgi:hypothetical protein
MLVNSDSLADLELRTMKRRVTVDLDEPGFGFCFRFRIKENSGEGRGWGQRARRGTYIDFFAWIEVLQRAGS